MTNELKAMIDAVISASKIITDDFIVENKGDRGDLVTTYDFAVEKHIITVLNAQFPDFDIISEEFNSDKGLTENCFIIDPIDGTVNFAHGLPCWVIQVGCIKNGKHHASLVYAPRFNEMYAGDKDGMFLNNTPVTLQNTSIRSSIFVMDSKNKSSVIKEVSKHIPHTRVPGSVGLDFALVSAGKAIATAYINNNIWDYLPGLMLVEFAGGYVIDQKDMHIAANNKDTLKLIKSCVLKAENNNN